MYHIDHFTNPMIFQMANKVSKNIMPQLLKADYFEVVIFMNIRKMQVEYINTRP